MGKYEIPSIESNSWRRYENCIWGQDRDEGKAGLLKKVRNMQYVAKYNLELA